MIRILAIILFVVIAFLLIRYRTNEKVQRHLVIGVSGALLVYVGYVFISELIR